MENKQMVLMDKVCSQEYFYLGENQIKAVFTDISCKIFGGDVVGVSADEDLAPKLLAEVIASIRPYYSGKCALLDFGIMRKKRMLLPHVFFADSPNIPYDNMNVLEYLMFVTANSEESPALRQIALLDKLVDYGLGYISLTAISKLTHGERFLVTAICAELSKSEIVVFNLCEYVLSPSEMDLLGGLFRAMTKNGGRCVICATMQASFIGMFCSKVLYVASGKQGYFGETEAMVDKYDRVKLLIADEDCAQTMQRVMDLFPEYVFEFDRENNRILVAVRTVEDSFQVDRFVSVLSRYGIHFDMIKLNKGRVKNSFEEIDRLVAVQK